MPTTPRRRQRPFGLRTATSFAGTEIVAGASIVQGDSDGTTFWVWTHEQDWYLVTSDDPAAGKAFVEAYVSAQHPSGA